MEDLNHLIMIPLRYFHSNKSLIFSDLPQIFELIKKGLFRLLVIIQFLCAPHECVSELFEYRRMTETQKDNDTESDRRKGC